MDRIYYYDINYKLKYFNELDPTLQLISFNQYYQPMHAYMHACISHVLHTCKFDRYPWSWYQKVNPCVRIGLVPATINSSPK